jgi:hypothetical protein
MYTIWIYLLVLGKISSGSSEAENSQFRVIQGVMGIVWEYDEHSV